MESLDDCRVGYSVSFENVTASTLEQERLTSITISRSYWLEGYSLTQSMTMLLKCPLEGLISNKPSKMCCFEEGGFVRNCVVGEFVIGAFESSGCDPLTLDLFLYV